MITDKKIPLRGVVLVVDDTPAYLRLVQQILTEEGYTVRLAPNGERALDFCQIESPDLILLDIRLPGIDGFEVCRRLKAAEQTLDIPVIFFSIVEDEKDKAEAFAVGGVDFINKPFLAEEKLARIDTHLTLRRFQIGLEQLVDAQTEELLRTNTQLRAEIEERRQVEVALEQRAAQLALLNQLGSQIAAELDLDSLLARAANLTQETFGYHHVGLFLVDPDTQTLVMRARAGEFINLFPADHRIEVGDGMVGWVASNGKPLLSNDVEEDPHYQKFTARKMPTQSELSFPIRIRSEIVGVLDVQSPQKNAFTENDVQVIETLVSQIATAIEKANSVEEIRRFSEIVAQVDAPYFLTDLDGTIEYVNPAFERVTGFSQDDALGQNANILKSNQMSPDYFQKLWQTILAGNIFTDVVINRRKNGEIWYYDQTILPLKAEDGNILNFVSTGKDITAQVQAEERQKQSENQYSTLFQNAMDCIFIMDGEEIVDANNAALRMFRVEMDEFIGKTPFDFSPKFQAGGIKTRVLGQPYLDGANAGEKQQFEWIHTRSDGTIFDSEVSLNLIDLSGKKLLISIVRDVSERKQAEEALKESARQLREAHEMAKLGYWFWDVATGEVEWSDEVYRIFHLDPDNFTPQIDSILALSPWPEENQRDQELIQRAIDSKEAGSYEQRFLRPDGSIGHYASTFQGIYDEAGELIDMKGTVQDITERKEQQQQVETLTERLALATSAAKVGIWDWEVKENILIWDDAMYRLYGLRPEEFGGAYEAWSAGVHPDDVDRSNADVQAALNGEKDFDSEFRVCWPDGSVHYIRGIAAVHRNEAGEAVRMIGVNWDITKQKETEQGLRQYAERLETLRAANLALSETLDFEAILKRLLIHLAEVVSYDSANVMLVEGDRVIVRAVHGYENFTDVYKILGQSLEIQTTSTIAPIVLDGQSNLISDTQADPGWEQVPGAEYVRNWFGVPLMASGEVIGLYSVDSSQPGYFTPEHVELAEALASQAAVAIQNARLHDQVQRHVENLEERVQQRTSELETANETLRQRSAELEMFNKAMVDRELRIIEMKEKVNQLCQELGREIAYPPVWKE